jgi:hypothetical protein
VPRADVHARRSSEARHGHPEGQRAQGKRSGRCKLFKNFLAAESKFIKSLEDNTRTCGVPPDAIKQAKEGHSKASAIGKQVCDAAAQGPRPVFPDDCRVCGETGDFGWPRDFQPLR